MISRTIKAFTLVEIIIVMAIIVLLAAVAIPGLLRARLNANESSALSSLQTISTTAQSYWAVNSKYPSVLSMLSTASPPYIDSVLGSGFKHGYSFSFSGSTYIFNATARPQKYTKSGTRSFFIDQSGVVRFTTQDAAATSIDSPVE